MSGVCAVQIDQKWVERNLGFDPILMPPPASTFAFSRAAQTSDPEDLKREIIDFDSESPGRVAIPCLHHGDRLVALHRCVLAGRIGTEDRA
jgi:hypothetical protein